MNILVIGNGGREHAFAWKLAQSPLADKIYVAPGNAGTAQETKVENVSIGVTDIPALLAFAQTHQIELTVVGPEAALAAGITDAFTAAGLACFGPTKIAAQLESSKAFAKDFLARHKIPTAAYATFSDKTAALNYIRSQSLPIVIKADGLAAGKGVVIAQTLLEAEQTLISMLEGNQFGDAGHRVVIEEFLLGEEASFICLVDGDVVIPMASSQDHKARDNNDQGPNTGGMGAYSPAPVVTPDMHEKIMRQVIEPTLQGLIKDGVSYTGFLYAGVMISPTGEPKVLEYNCRFGDPETQPIMMRLQSDFAALCLKACQHQLTRDDPMQWDPRAALGVVMAAGGYPNNYPKGDAISGLDTQATDVKIFHAGTRLEDKQVVTDGGRVLCVTALGETVSIAQQRAYATVKNVSWDQAFCRTDIGYRAIAREK